MVTYTVKGDELIRTSIAQAGTYRQCFKPNDAMLQLGNHPMADTIRSLKISERPLLSRMFLERAAILPSGVVVEGGISPSGEYQGSDYEGMHKTIY